MPRAEKLGEPDGARISAIILRADARSLGSLLFCPDCGTLLNLPQDGESTVACSQCQHEEPVECKFCCMVGCHC